jgi:hypothetical protein
VPTLTWGIIYLTYHAEKATLEADVTGRRDAETGNRDGFAVDAEGRVCLPLDGDLIPLSTVRWFGGPVNLREAAVAGPMEAPDNAKTEQFIAEFAMLCEKYNVVGFRGESRDHDENVTGETEYLKIDGDGFYQLIDIVPETRFTDL